ncbi:DUF3667 domain-containing protein [Qipengyuania qiaonensis]|uniref:DUF3667 domain-containing protein n=1 Tax=Qipengyuania qiaonensis TaxID=2867240 RepID=A0ABS7J9K2_9SPHN|nr:DUF3667 domain-containing protein [Qipengyuania qiaonensis]MBX7484001.1 DUF3667 domain-containing protein [Qipengyuania qiaonensis]
MTEDFGDLASGASDAATGGLIARTLEDPTGLRKGHTRENACLNCGAELVGAHCHNCGQRAHIHRTLGAFFHDLLHGVLHFEGKTWRTLPLLVWKPGKLTREYIDGKRASYVSPIALFLFVVFFSYALFSALGGDQALSPQVTGFEQAKAAYATNEEELVKLRNDRQRNLDDPESLARIDAEIQSLEDDQKGLGTVLGGVGDEFEKDFIAGFEKTPLPEDSGLAKAIEKVRKNPQLAIYKAQTNAYKFSWMLIPLSVPFVWLLFPFNRRFKGYDHTVFTTYSIAFMIMLVAVVSLLFYYGWGGLGGLLLFYAPWHMYRQLRGAYELGRWGALWRMLTLSMFAWVAIGLFISVIGAMAA